jgi:predicted permease
MARRRFRFSWRTLDEVRGEVDEELRFHLEMRTRELIEQGVPPDEARDLAVKQFGDVRYTKQYCIAQDEKREAGVRRFLIFDEFSQDLRFALRWLRKSPGFAVVTVVTLALGIGANTAIFTLLDQALLRLLPVKDPSALVLVTADGFQYGNGWGAGDELSYPRYTDVRDHNEVFTGMFCRFGYVFHLSFDGRTERVQGELVSGTYFPVLGVGAHLGRTFTSEEDLAPNGHPVAMLGHAYWKSRFAGDPTIIGKTLVVSSVPMTIIGVAPEGFNGVDKASAAQVYVPIMMASQLTPIRDPLTDRRMRWLNVFGRLRPGVTAEQGRAAMQPFYSSRLQMEVTEAAFARASAADKEKFLKGTVAVSPAGDGKADLSEQLTRPLWMLMTIVACVLLIACANVANLLLARANARQREMAIRLAIGASRRRIIQQLVVESLLLTVLGGLLGLLLATWGASFVLTFFRSPERILTLSATPDLRVLVFTFLISLITALLFGLMPARHATRPELAPTLKNEASAVVGGSSTLLRKALVISQVALSLLLLVGAGLFIRSLHNLLTVNTGYDTTHLISFTVDPSLNGYEGVRSKQFAKGLLDEIQRTPGVAAAGFSGVALLAGGSWNSRMTIEGRPAKADERVVTHNNPISHGYFTAMGMKILAGRDFDARDERMGPVSPDTPPASVIVNQTFVKLYLGTRYPIGIRIGFGRDPGTPTPIEIIGVVSDAKYRSLRGETEPQAFFAYLSAPDVRGFTMYVRTAREPEAMFDALRRVVQRTDPNLPLYAMETFAERVERSVLNERMVASLSSVFGVLATLLAMIGLYGVMAYTVARRTREIGIRMALGARSSAIRWLVIREVLVIAAIGVGVALPTARWMGRYVESQLFGVDPTDARTIAGAVLLLAAVLVLAGLVPSSRAARVDPIRALRAD